MAIAQYPCTERGQVSEGARVAQMHMYSPGVRRAYRLGKTSVRKFTCSISMAPIEMLGS